MHNILFSSVGRRSYLVEYFRQAMQGGDKIIGTNCIADTPGMHAADIPIVVPRAAAPDYLPTMLGICKKHKVKLLFSLHDLEASFLAKERDQFEAIGTKLMMPAYEHLRVCLDKYALVKCLLAHGLAAPKTILGNESVKASLASKSLCYPLVIKPRFAAGSIGLSVATSDEELTACLEQCRQALENSPFRDAVIYDTDAPIMVQQKVDGQEYGLDILNNLEGEFVACFVIRKAGMRGGETDAAETVHSPMLEELGQSISQILKHPGLIDVDVIVQDDRPHVIDLNPRFGGHYPFAHMGGANAPAAIVAWMKGEPERSEWLRMKPNVYSYKDISIVKVTS